MACGKESEQETGAEDRRRDLKNKNKIHTSGIPAACSHESSFGLCKSMLVETEIYSAYAPVSHAISAQSSSQC